MEARKHRRPIHPLWWTAALFASIIAIVLVCSALFAGTFRSFVPVTLASERSGLVMESGASVKMRGVEVGRVAGITGGEQPVSLKLEIFPDQVDLIPANVQAEIRATTAFGAKYVALIYPDEPVAKHIAAGAVLWSRNVSTEVNTVFDNLVGLLDQIDVSKLSEVLTAVADGVRGQGEQMGRATTAANEVLSAINPRMDTVAEDWRSFKGFSDAYSVAAQDILATLDAASTTSATITDHADDLDAVLLNTIGFSNSGIGLLGPNRDTIVDGINVLEPTTNLLHKYNPEYTCLLTGAKHALDNGAYENIGGNGRSVVQDVGLLFGDDPYRYPEDLPIVAARGGPGGKPGCGSLPDVSKDFPVDYLVTNTGYGTGLDVRPNPGIGFPGIANFFPVTKAVPEPPRIRHPGGPAPGPASPPPPPPAPPPAPSPAPTPTPTASP